MTTHDVQVARYVEEYSGPETTATVETVLDSEIAQLLKEIVEQQRQLRLAQDNLERLTDTNLAAVQAAPAGQH